MSEIFRSSYTNPNPYVPATLSEIYDMLASLAGGAPTFADEMFPERTIDSEFDILRAALDIVRGKLGEERHTAAMDLAARAKALFLEDQANDNGKTMQGIKLIFEIEDIIQAARKRRSKAGIADEDGRVTGD
ncbi:MAG: hypothetical protein V4537_18005 [Pseudomonadota bacterium]